MHTKGRVMYMAFGCLLTLAGYILAGLANDSVAQSRSEDVTFGTITCRKLTVIDDEGESSAVLFTDKYGGRVVAYVKGGGSAELYSGLFGGSVTAYSKNDGWASLGNGLFGGMVELTNNEYGGSKAIFNKDGESVLQVGVGNRGEGIIKTKNGVRNFDGEVAEPTTPSEQQQAAPTVIPPDLSNDSIAQTGA